MVLFLFEFVYNLITKAIQYLLICSTEEEGSSDVTEDDKEELTSRSPVLYIQMEFCESKTLREVINTGDCVRHRNYMRIIQPF